MKKFLKVLLIIFIILLLFIVAVSFLFVIKKYKLNKDSGFKQKYFDVQGISYENFDEVPLYDKNNNKYTYLRITENTFSYYVNNSTNEKLIESSCYVDENGFFFYDSSNILRPVELDDNEFSIKRVFKDDKGNKYYLAYGTVFDQTGKPFNVNYGYYDD